MPLCLVYRLSNWSSFKVLKLRCCLKISSLANHYFWSIPWRTFQYESKLSSDPCCLSIWFINSFIVFDCQKLTALYSLMIRLSAYKIIVKTIVTSKGKVWFNKFLSKIGCWGSIISASYSIGYTSLKNIYLLPKNQ